MSLRARLLVAWLRRVEKTFLTRATDVAHVRRSFRSKAKLYFHGPRVAKRTEHLNGVEVLRLTPPQAANGPQILYFHGGAYVFGAPETHQAMMAVLAHKTNCPVDLPRYRLAPETAHPGAIEDALTVYKARIAQGPVIIGGDSAGGGLALALLAQILVLGLPKPLGTFAFSPLTDLTFSGESITQNAEIESVLPSSRIAEMSAEFLQGHDPKDPRASPLFGDFTEAPPVWLTVADTEILRDDTLRMTHHLRDHAVAVTEIVEHALPHVWPLFHTILPEARHTLTALGAWITSLSPKPDES